MSEYQPGTVAVATVRGVEGVRVMRTTGRGGADVIWLSPEFIGGTRCHYAHDLTDIRPLVVLDWHPNPTELPGLLNLLRNDFWTSLADQIEAQTKSPRIPEPGWGAIVEAGLGPVKSAGHRTKLVRANRWDDDRWVREDGARYEWDELIDPIEIRKGVESGA